MFTSIRIPPVTIALALLASLASTQGLADIYRWTDADGNTIYSDQKRSEQAQTTTLNQKAVTYYSAPKAKQELSQMVEEAYSTLATIEPVKESESDAAPPTEAECQKQYRRSCDEVKNWRKYALEKCGNDARCDDPGYLDRKYRPRTTAELREIARRAAVRRNNIDDRIDEFLRKRFTNQCENQARLYCSQQRSRNCLKAMVAHCEDPRSLGDILARYDHLSPNEKRAIIEKAKKLALANGKDSLDYDEMIASLVEILISSTLMGL